MASKKKNTLRNLLIAGGILLVLVIIANKAGWIGKKEVIQVATDKVTKLTVSEMVSASGKIQPENIVKLSSEVSGEIVELLIKEGDVVVKGQMLCRIRPDILQSGYDRAIASLNAQKASLAASEQQLIQQEANFANVESTFRRNKSLFDKKVISTAEFEKIQADYLSSKANLEAQRQNVTASRYGIDQSQAAVKEAGDNLAKTTIYAPVDGVISLLSAELGERVVGTAQMAGTEIMRIANMSSMEVNVEVNENDITRVSVGNEATIEVDAFQGRQFKGVVTEIASSSTTALSANVSADQVTNFNVKVRILSESYQDLLKEGSENPSPFRPGLSASVDIHTSSDSGLVVPIQSVTTREDSDLAAKAASEDSPTADSDQSAPASASSDSESSSKSGQKKIKEYVFVYSDGQVKLKEVTTGIQDDSNIRILSGLNEGDEVVSRPFNAISKTLKDGSIVEKVDRDKLR